MEAKKLQFETSNGIYTVKGEKIGEGGFGKVYRGTDPKGHKVAIKFLQKKKYKDLMETFGTLGSTTGAEIKALKLFNGDPHIVSIYDQAVCNEETAVIVMEYCSDGTLEDLVTKKGCLTEEKSVKYLTQIAKGLTRIHKQGIMHRDLKPANILMKDKICKIGDFGLVTAKSKAEGFAGTPLYASPEVTAWSLKDGKAKPYTKAVDIYSLGQILLFMLTGEHPPFAPEQLKDLDLSKSLASLLRDMLNPDPVQRLAAQEILDKSEELIERGKLKSTVSKPTEAKVFIGKAKEKGSELSSSKGASFVTMSHWPSTMSSLVSPAKPLTEKKDKSPISMLSTSSISPISHSGMLCNACGLTGHYANQCPITGGYEANVTCYTCGKRGHYSPQCPHGSPSYRSSSGTSCYSCGGFGHYANQCPLTGGYAANVTCYSCGKRGHYAPQCPRR